MESIRIHEKNYDIVLYLDKNKFFGYKFNNDNTIEKIDKNVFKYFDFFVCSNNYTVLPGVDDYKVVLDNETNFKHYFKGGSEDYNMFFLNNGTKEISFNQKRTINDLIKNISISFIIGSTTVCLTLGAFNLIQLHTNNVIQPNISTNEVISAEKRDLNEQKEDRLIEQVVSGDITYDDIKNLIYSSSNLNQEEKDYINNEDLLRDVIDTINNYNITKYDLLRSFKDLDIRTYNDGLKEVDGYYIPNTPNIIFIKNYDGLTSETRDIVAHEQIHLLQYHYLDYSLLKEATAEIISNEYNKNSNINAYSDQIYLTKKLMEIIGPDPVWYYVFTGDFTSVEKEVKPYLNDKEYSTFLYCLKYDYYNSQDNKEKIEKLNTLLDTIYKNKYNANIRSDQIIPLLNDKSTNLKRYYFNKRYINRENSYYEDETQVTNISMTLNEAVLKDYIHVIEDVKEYIPDDKIYDYLKSHDNKGLKRHCVYINDFKETSIKYSDKEVRISGYLNGKYYDNVLEKDLIEKGIIINSNYYYIRDKKVLSAEEYFNKKYDPNNKLEYVLNHDKCYFATYSSQGDILIYISTKQELPTISERFENSKVR